ncbi:MAG: DUF1513 domain-containing protein [Rhodobacteraceae bacterium]|nr:DUF1513 domain-containing protein [Paracoccaceae bacterium]
MARRRTFLGGLLATGLGPAFSWAKVGNPRFLSAAKTPQGAYVLCGLDSSGQITFKLPLPARGHAAAAHPSQAKAVAFARRPGRFALVLNCATGEEIAALQAPTGRHFYGHGTYSADGSVLFTTENDYETARGLVGVWDVTRTPRRIAEFLSGGVGPHDIKMLPDGHTLVVANGGIETHPDTGRVKLNIPTMQSNLTYLSLDGDVLEQVELDAGHQRNSIRHLAVSQDGTVAFAMQWQGGAAPDRPLLGTHRRSDGSLTLVPKASVQALNGYIGSVAISEEGSRIAITSPRRGVAQLFDQVQLTSELEIPDVCGISAVDGGFFVTSGNGICRSPQDKVVRHPLAWDNHLVPVGNAGA